MQEVHHAIASDPVSFTNCTGCCVQCIVRRLSANKPTSIIPDGQCRMILIHQFMLLHVAIIASSALAGKKIVDASTHRRSCVLS